MRNHDRRVLREYGIDPAEWAVLFAASFYEPISWRRFVELAVWESDGAIPEQEVADALQSCIDNNWVTLSNDLPSLFSSSQDRDETVVLTELGYQLKNSV